MVGRYESSHLRCSALKMEAARFSQSLVTAYQNTRRHEPGNSIIPSCRLINTNRFLHIVSLHLQMRSLERPDRGVTGHGKEVNTVCHGCIQGVTG